MKTPLLIIFCMVSFTMFAQSGASKTAPLPKVATCYDQWYSLFKERGANPLADGTHDVIISIRNEYDYAECFSGKIDVKDGKLASKLQIQKVDGTFEEFDKKISSSYQNSDGVMKEELRNVSNGMSESFTLADGEKIRLFFYKSIAEKAKANKKAPTPSSVVKN